MFRIAYFIDVMLLALGIAAVYAGVFDLGFWSRFTPGGGFMPSLIGVFLIFICALSLLDKHKASVSAKFAPKLLLPPLAILAVLGMTNIVGMFPSLALMVFCWLKFVEKYSFGKSAIISFGIIFVTYAIFGVWLRVFFPSGLLRWGNFF